MNPLDFLNFAVEKAAAFAGRPAHTRRKFPSILTASISCRLLAGGCQTWLAAACAALALSPPCARAQSVLPSGPATFWLGQTDGTWTGFNWASNAVGTPSISIPTSADDITFSATGATNENTTLNADFEIHSLTINDPVAVTIGGTNTLKISGTSGTTGLTVNAGAGLFTINASLTLVGAASVVTVNNAAGAVINSVITTNSGLTLQGAGTLTLGGLNVYTGATTINGGTLAAGSGDVFSPNSQIVLSAAGTLDLAGSDNTIGSLSDGVGGGGLVTDSVGGAALYIGNDNKNASFSGTISGLFSIDKLGTGTQTLSGVNPIDIQRLNIQQGTLALVNGSLLNGVTVFVGTDSGATGTLLVDNSQLTNVNLIVGVTGNGVLTLQHGAIVTGGSGPTVIGQFSGASGTVNVLDSTCTFNPAGPLFIGDSGAGTVNLQKGASLTTNDTILGFLAGSSGVLNLDGASVNASLLYVGNPGTGGSGILRVLNGSTVNVTDLVVAPTGAIEIGGSNTFNVPAATFIFDGGTLRAVQNATFTSGATLFGNGIVLDSAGPTGTLTGILTGTGGLTKTGAGEWIIEGVQQYTGNTVINGGLLAVNGTIQSPQVLVNSPGTLGGSGTILGSVINHGIVSPGDAPGTLHINGSYTQASDGTLSIQIASPTNFSRLVVGGHASIDGTLALSFEGFKPKRGESFQFLTATGGVTGQFAQILSNTQFNLLTFTVVNEGNALVLTTQTAPFLTTLHGLTPNQQAVAASLDSALLDPRMSRILDYLTTQPLPEIPRDLDRIAPEELTSIFTLGVSLAQVQSQNLQRRTDDIRSGSSGFSAAGLAINGGGPGYSGSLGIGTGATGPGGDEGKEDKTLWDPVVETRWGAFLSGTGEWVNVSGTDNARGYTLDSGGFTLGVDYKVTPHFAIGLMAGYTGTSADLTDHGRVDVNGGKIGIYATTFTGAWYADVAATGGYDSYDTRRSALDGMARGDTDGGEVNALLGTGYDFKKGGLTFGPTATFNYTDVATDGFTEHGSLAPLNIHGGSGESLRTAFGFKASYDWTCGGIVIKPEIRAAWQHEYGDAAYALDSSFANGAGNSFLVNGPQLGRDSALLGAGFAIQFNERMATYFYYDGELGRKNYESNSVTGGLRVAF